MKRAYERFLKETGDKETEDKGHSATWESIPSDLWGRIAQYLSYPDGSLPELGSYCIWIPDGDRKRAEICRVTAIGNFAICLLSEVLYE